MRPLRGLAREERQAEEPAQSEPEPAADVMTLIERWVCVCPEHGVSPQAHTRAFPEHGCWFWSTDDSHCRAEVEWVRLTSDRGAVEALDALRRAADAFDATLSSTVDGPERDAMRAASVTASRVGGQ